MKGKLLKTKQGWVIKYLYSHVNGNLIAKELQVHHDDADNLDSIKDAYDVLNNKEVEFNIIEVILNTNDNRVILNDYAKIVEPKFDNNETWKDIFVILQTKGWDYIESNYNVPTRK